MATRNNDPSFSRGNWRAIQSFPTAFLACLLNFAHRAFVAFEIFALAAADISTLHKPDILILQRQKHATDRWVAALSSAISIVLDIQ
jgi:hypothetical protein